MAARHVLLPLRNVGFSNRHVKLFLHCGPHTAPTTLKHLKIQWKNQSLSPPLYLYIFQRCPVRQTGVLAPGPYVWHPCSTTAHQRVIPVVQYRAWLEIELYKKKKPTSQVIFKKPLCENISISCLSTPEIICITTSVGRWKQDSNHYITGIPSVNNKETSAFFS